MEPEYAPGGDGGGSVIRPHFIARLSTVTADTVRDLCRNDLLTELANIWSLEATIHRHRDTASERLAVAIGGVEDRVARRMLIELRRDLYNGRRIKADALAAGEERISADARCVIAEHSSLRAALTAAATQFECEYRNALANERARLREYVLHADFQKAVLLSSPSLYANIPRYREAVYSARVKSREERIERGLMRYFTRAAMKATPFGRFCAVLPGLLEISRGADNARSVAIHGDLTARRGFVCLSKAVYAVLWPHLKEVSAVRNSLIVRVNPTLRRDGESLDFLAVHGNKETFRRVEDTPAISTAIDIVSRDDYLKYGALTKALSAAGANGSLSLTTTFADELVKLGLLQLETVVPENVPDWDSHLVAFLETISDVVADSAAHMLRDVRRLAKAYESAPSEVRSTIGPAISERLRMGCESLGLDAKRLTQQPIFEDVTARAKVRIRCNAAAGVLADLKEFLCLVRPVAYFRQEIATMRRFFDIHYGTATTAVALLRFYEDYARAHFKELLAARLGHRAPGRVRNDKDLVNPYALHHVEALRAAQRRLACAVGAAWAADTRDSEEVRLTRGDLLGALAGVDASCNDSCSVAVFVQFCGSAAAPRLVVNGAQCVTGYGKLYSRFLYMLSRQFRSRVREGNRNLAMGVFLAEIGGDANFNANMHEPLLPAKILYPGTEYTDGTGLSCAELDVVRAEADEWALWLIHRPTGRRVIPVDLGFLTPVARPALYQLLLRFTPPSIFGIGTREVPAGTIPSFSGNASGDARVIHIPRVVYKANVILARRRWLLSDGCFPSQALGETDAQYFVRVNRWRTTVGIPSEVYARVFVIKEGSAVLDGGEGLPHCSGVKAGDAISDQDDERRVDREPRRQEATRQPGYRGGDWRKPQYINFGSPLHMKLFARIAGPLRRFQVDLEERYPQHEDLPLHDGQAYSSELVLQLDLPASRAP